MRVCWKRNMFLTRCYKWRAWQFQKLNYFLLEALWAKWGNMLYWGHFCSKDAEHCQLLYRILMLPMQKAHICWIQPLKDSMPCPRKMICMPSYHFHFIEVIWKWNLTLDENEDSLVLYVSIWDLWCDIPPHMLLLIQRWPWTFTLSDCLNFTLKPLIIWSWTWT